MRLWVLALAPVAIAACSSDNGVHVGIGPSLEFPEGTLTNVTKLTVQVFDQAGGVDCDTTTGALKGNGPAIASQDLQTAGCASGAKFCGNIQVDESPTPRVFLAQGFPAGSSNPVATGCTVATVNQATIPVTIKMIRVAPPATCGGKPSPLPATQCDNSTGPSDPICDTNCVTKEMFLTNGDGTYTFTMTHAIRPSLVWPSGAVGTPGNLSTGYFCAFYQHNGGTKKAAMRMLGADMTPTSDFGSNYLTNGSLVSGDPSGATVPPSGITGSQQNPSGAIVGSLYYLAYEVSAAPATRIDVRSLSSPVKSAAVATASNTGSTASNQPSLAANGAGKLFVAWQSGGNILGATVDPSGLAVGTQQTLGSGQNVVVAGTSGGWVVAYESGSNVNMQLVDGTGKGKGEIKVNDTSHSGSQQHPGVAVTSGDHIAVDWIDTGTNGVFFQRFDGTGAPVVNNPVDQSVRIDTNGGSAAAGATMGSGSPLGGFFVAAWVDNSTGQVRARLIGPTSGFLFNNVTGQSDDFGVSKADGATRANPAVAVGGNNPTTSAPFIAIAWEVDSDPQFPGIWARRFDIPAQ